MLNLLCVTCTSPSVAISHQLINRTFILGKDGIIGNLKNFYDNFTFIGVSDSCKFDKIIHTSFDLTHLS